MDIYCPTCAEPTDIDYLHDVAKDNSSTFDKVLNEFYALGCQALDPSGRKPEWCKPTKRASLASVVYDLMGDDVDGAASMFEDAEAMGLW